MSESVKTSTSGCVSSDTLAAKRVRLRAELDTARADFIKAALAIKVLRAALDSVLRANEMLINDCHQRTDNNVSLLLIAILVVAFLIILF